MQFCFVDAGVGDIQAELLQQIYYGLEGYNQLRWLLLGPPTCAALTALLGIVLIRAGLIPGIRTFTTSAEIIAWALIFGYSQQIFTGVIDRQARTVLEQSNASRRPAPSFRTQD
jgi:hypothetical protein